MVFSQRAQMRLTIGNLSNRGFPGMATLPDEKAWGEGAVVPAKMFKLSKQTWDADSKVEDLLRTIIILQQINVKHVLF